MRFGQVSFVVGIENTHEPVSSADEETDSGRDGAAAPVASDPVTAELLSEAQRRVFDLLLSGTKEKSIARRLELSPHTVHNHVCAIFRVFEVHSRTELLARLLKRGVE